MRNAHSYIIMFIFLFIFYNNTRLSVYKSCSCFVVGVRWTFDDHDPNVAPSFNSSFKNKEDIIKYMKAGGRHRSHPWTYPPIYYYIVFHQTYMVCSVGTLRWYIRFERCDENWHQMIIYNANYCYGNYSVVLYIVALWV